jgi:hypothetical protein
MSKSLGNGIDPLEIIEKYGADALRFALSTGNSPGNDMRFSDEKMEAARNFANKLWNASRFVRMNLTIDKVELPEEGRLSLIRISLLTGRTHQIRVQFSSRGTPLLGDRKYGAPSHGAIGLFSHAITFPHPKTGKCMTFSANPHGGAWELF